MNRAYRHITSALFILVLAAGTATAQFDLAGAPSASRLAASKYFTVSNGVVSTFESPNLFRPIALISTGTILVERTHAATAVAGTAVVPDRFALDQNYPNPFNNSTKIVYSLPARSTVSLIVFDILGREIATLVNGPVAAGKHAVDFSSTALASGAYFYRLAAVGPTGAVSVEMKKMILLK